MPRELHINSPVTLKFDGKGNLIGYEVEPGRVAVPESKPSAPQAKQQAPVKPLSMNERLQMAAVAGKKATQQGLSGKAAFDNSLRQTGPVQVRDGVLWPK